MKIGAVSNIGFKSNLKQNEKINPYMYTYNENYRPKFSFKENKAEYIGGFCALVAAAVSLSKFIGRKTTPKSVVELADKTMGFNKLKDSKITVSQIKENILYPIMAVANGEKSLLKGDYKTGLIIGGKESEKLCEFMNAFMEHAKALNIHTVEIKAAKTNKVKEAHKAIDKALNYFNAKGESVIVNIGDLSAVSKHNISKTNYASSVEERLARMPKGVLWTAYTTKSAKLPYFYNNLPTLFTKLAD